MDKMKRKKLKLIGSLYFSAILLFGFVYWILWIVNPSNYIINSDYNEHTIKPFYFHGDMDTLETKYRIVSARETNERIAPFYDSIHIVKLDISEFELQLKDIKKKDSLNSINQNDFFSKKINTEVYNSTKVFVKKIDSLNSILNLELKSLKSVNQNSQEYFDKQVVISKLRYAISLQELELNRQKLKIFNTDFSEFYSDSLNKIGLCYYYKIDSLEKINSLKLEKIADLTENIRLNVVEYYLGQINKVRVFDFIYFSIVTATSTGYGDILPNSTFVRILVSIEIFLSLFLFGFFFYYIAKPNEKTENQNYHQPPTRGHDVIGA